MSGLFFVADFWDGGCLTWSADLDAARAGFGVGSRQNSSGNPVFCLLWSPRSAELELGVDKIRQEILFFVYFGAVVGGFRRGSRQNSSGNLVFCLLWSPRGADLESVVEHFFKFWRFCST